MGGFCSYGVMGSLFLRFMSAEARRPKSVAWGKWGLRGGAGALQRAEGSVLDAEVDIHAHLADSIDAEVTDGLVLIAGSAIDHGVPQLLRKVLSGGSAVQLTGVPWGRGGLIRTRS